MYAKGYYLLAKKLIKNGLGTWGRRWRLPRRVRGCGWRARWRGRDKLAAVVPVRNSTLPPTP